MTQGASIVQSHKPCEDHLISAPVQQNTKQDTKTVYLYIDIEEKLAHNFSSLVSSGNP